MNPVFKQRAPWPLLLDDDLAYMAQVALTWNRCLPPGQVRAQVESGWLTLSGQVLRDAQRQDAEDCLRDLPGLAGVTNRITIKPKAPAPSIKRVP